ncbi:MAG: hypothetical protein EU533_07530 [Promethearchaeota archaeon]|nr:MAG: hypothetical protein EU533_07530 [Candidatus Lokiarchaeota archaeon]
MKELIELGIVFRGFILVKYLFKNGVSNQDNDPCKDLRGPFITAINSFAQNAFNNLSLEYLESSNNLFIFKIHEIKALDSDYKEHVILYGLTERKKNPDKIVRKFFEKSEPIMQLFLTRYNNKDFTELNQFEPFQDEIKQFFD